MAKKKKSTNSQTATAAAAKKIQNEDPPLTEVGEEFNKSSSEKVTEVTSETVTVDPTATVVTESGGPDKKTTEEPVTTEDVVETSAETTKESVVDPISTTTEAVAQDTTNGNSNLNIEEVTTNDNSSSNSKNHSTSDYPENSPKLSPAIPTSPTSLDKMAANRESPDVPNVNSEVEVPNSDNKPPDSEANLNFSPPARTGSVSNTDQKESTPVINTVSTEDRTRSTSDFFNVSGKSQIGLEIWRIEKLKAVPWPKSLYGTFYSGDSYIVLNTIELHKKYDLYYWLGKSSSVDEKGCCALKAIELDQILNDVPIQYRECEGYESKQFLGVFRDISGGVKYLEGGVESAFNEVKPEEYKAKLLQVKGKRVCRVKEVKCERGMMNEGKRIYKCERGGMNEGDAFLLDNGLRLFIYKGKSCNKYEAVKCCQLARQIKDERSTKVDIIHMNDDDEENDDDGIVGTNTVTDSARKEFWTLLGGEGPIPDAESGGSDELSDRVSGMEVKLYKIQESESDQNQQQVSTLVKSGSPFDPSLLDSKCIYLLDSGSYPSPGLFIWCGKDTSKSESMLSNSKWKKHSIEQAQKWSLENLSLKDENSTNNQNLNDISNVSISRIVQGTEGSNFKTFFQDFDRYFGRTSATIVRSFDSQASGIDSKVAKMRASEVNIQSMHEESPEKKKQQSSSSSKFQSQSKRDPLCESLSVYRVENFQLTLLQEQDIGEFHEGDSYIIEYQYYRNQEKSGSPIEVVLYFWQGSKSTQDEKGASAMLCQQLDDQKYHGIATQVRIPMGKEPQEFLGLFQGRMIVHKGGCPSAFRSSIKETLKLKSQTSSGGEVQEEQEEEWISENYYPKLYHIRGNNYGPNYCRAIQIKPISSLLNSNDVFVLFPDYTKGSAFIWKGKGASQQEQALGRDLVEKMDAKKGDSSGLNLNNKITEIEEGCEDDKFWDTFLNGEEEYNSSDYEKSQIDYEPRLFQVSNATGALRVDEICNFTQEDLIPDDVMLLDVIHSVFVWVGNLAHQQEKQEAPKIADEYIQTATDGRDISNVPIILVKQNAEPMLFTHYFMNWDNEYFSKIGNSSRGLSAFDELYELKRKQKLEEEENKKQEEEKERERASIERAEKIKELEKERESKKSESQSPEKKAGSEVTERESKKSESQTQSPTEKKVTDSNVEQPPPTSASPKKSESESAKKSESSEKTQSSTLPKGRTSSGGWAPVKTDYGLASVNRKSTISSVTSNIVGSSGLPSDRQSSSVATASLSATAITNKGTKLGENKWAPVSTGGYIGRGETSSIVNVKRNSGVTESKFSNDNNNNSTTTAAASTSNTAVTGTSTTSESNFADPSITKYPLADLIRKNVDSETSWPKNVDPKKRELYLSEEEFKTVMGITFEEWGKLAMWKQAAKKKEKGLF